MGGDLAAKVAAAQAAVETAAALLMDHAEGLAMLVALERGVYPAEWMADPALSHTTEELAPLSPLPAGATERYRTAAALAVARDGEPHHSPEADPWRRELRRMVHEA